MNYIHYSKPDTRKGEIMDKYTPLQNVDYAMNRKSDRKPEHQPGAGAIAWAVAAIVCWIVVLVLAAKAGYFN